MSDIPYDSLQTAALDHKHGGRSEPPDTYSRQIERLIQRGGIGNYLASLDLLHKFGSGGWSSSWTESEANGDTHRVVFHHLQQARVVQVPLLNVFQALADGFAVLVQRSRVNWSTRLQLDQLGRFVCPMSWGVGQSARAANPDPVELRQSKAYSEAGIDLMREIGTPPTALPFPYVFYTTRDKRSHLTLTPMQLVHRLKGPDSDPAQLVEIADKAMGVWLGLLVGPDAVVDVTALAFKSGEWGLAVSFVYDAGKWSEDGKWSHSAATTGMGPLAHTLTDAVNAHKSTVLEAPVQPDAQERQLIKHVFRRLDLKLCPQPWYESRIQNLLIREPTREDDSQAPQRVLSHRYDRRGHERCKIRMGPLPLAPDKLKWLKDHDYRVYTSQPLTPDDAERLAFRGKHRPRGHWVGVKHCWIVDKVCGPTHLPYVPAVRTLDTLDPLGSA